MRVSDFDFELPPERIALRPAVPRESAKLLVVSPAELRDRTVADLPGELRAGDRQLATKAGVKTEGRVVFQFYSEATYKSLLALEATRKGNRRIKDVRRTVFGVKANQGRYEFYVIDQQYMGS